MWLIRRTAVPEDALLKTYRGGVHPEHWGHYADCFSVIIDRPIDIAAFVTAFYTSPIFRVERWVLRCVAAAPSTDADARAVAEGTGSSFAVWRVGARTRTELLMCDRYERTRSWFRVVPAGNCTLLQFGSAVAATRPNERSGGFGASFHLLSRFHVLYSQILLHAAKARAAQMARVPTR